MSAINPALVEEVIAGLEPIHVTVLGELDEFYGHGPDWVARRTGIAPDDAKAALRHLRREGVATLTPLYDEDDGQLRGRGYWLDAFGRAVSAKLFPDGDDL